MDVASCVIGRRSFRNHNEIVLLPLEPVLPQAGECSCKIDLATSATLAHGRVWHETCDTTHLALIADAVTR
jgi:hypothetical protein